MAKDISSKVTLGDLVFIPAKEHETWAFFKPEIAMKDNVLYLRNKGSEMIYVQGKENKKYTCLTCGSDIIQAEIAHPIHDGPFPGSGSGKCEYEQSPYCPKCEEQPNYHGSIIKEGFNAIDFF